MFKGILCLLIFFTFTFGASASDESKNTTYRFAYWNILMDLAVDKWSKKDIPLWHWRKQAFFKKLDSINADIYGFGEALPWQANHIHNHLKEYNRVGYKHFSDATLFYKKSKFKEVNRGWFFLSNRPNEPYTVDYGHVLPRLAVWVELKTCDHCPSFIALSTHLDGLKEARQKMLSVIDQQLNKLHPNKQTIILGDLNISFQDKGYRIIENLGWYNSYSPTFRQIQKQTITYRGRQVDHILFKTKNGIKIHNWELFKALQDNVKLSDHDGVFSDLEFNKAHENAEVNLHP